MKFCQQPANSPDMNVCDLTFFHSIKTTLKGKRWQTKQEMMRDLERSWDLYFGERLEAGWRLLYTIYRGILSSGGDNNFKRGAGVRARIRRGLGVNYDCPQDTYDRGETERDRLQQHLGLHYDNDSESGASNSEHSGSETEESDSDNE